MQRQMVMVGFLQAQNCTNLVSSWRHPESREDSWSPDFYATIGRVLEEGKFHVGFFDDRLAMPDRYGNDHRHTVQHGIRCVKMDPVTVLMVMGMATKRLGLGSTRSTTYYEPFDVARTFATIDLMTNGRAAWNVVTSMNDGEALNMGRDLHMEHDRRYDRAEEFMHVVMGHWNSWDDDAIVQDKKTGLFADPDKVRRIDHVGEYFRSRGPFTVPRSKQGHPVIIQAGQSGPGKRFAARWGELLFVGSPVTLDAGRKNYREIKDSVAAQGRDPQHCIIAPSAYVIAAESKMAAEDKAALIETLATDEDALSLLSEAMNVDFATKELDEPFTDEELPASPARSRCATGSCSSQASRIRRRKTSSRSAGAPVPTSPSSVGRRKSRMGWRSGSPPGFAMASWSPRHTCPALMWIREIRDPGTAAARPVSQGLRG
jgi:FMN-dependent oxidoreductase (nitrilotriacetate monooxygenase family)